MLVASLIPINGYAQIGPGESGGATAPPTLPPKELDELVAPIALYPDVLVAQILPASTFSIEVVKAARWLRSSPDMSELDGKSWDPSVLSLCRYPAVIYKLDQDLDWTAAVGVAFLSQPKDVMEAIQRLRRRAGITGTLQSNQQQTIVFEKQTIRIVPTQPDVVYVPVYNSQIVYLEVDDDDDDSVGAAAVAISFGAGLALGAWLDTDCDWHHGQVYYCRPGYWGGWRHAGVVRYDQNWVAARGRYRGFVAGDHGGAYVGPRGAAVWGDNGHAAVWRRPTGHGTPRYTGRYASYNQRYGGAYGRGGHNYTQVNRGSVVSGNEITINRNNLNIDRGDRTAIRGGDRTGVRSGDRTRSRSRSGETGTPGSRSSRSGGDYRGSRSAFGSTHGDSQTGRYGQRGKTSRAAGRSTSDTSGSGRHTGRSAGSTHQGGGSRAPDRRKSSADRSSSGRAAGSRAGAGSRHRSSFGDSRSSRQVNRHSARGSASRRSAGARRGGRRR